MIELSERTIKALPIPSTGSKITYFAEASRTGKAPVGFAVRVTSAGGRAFLLCYRDRTGEHRATIGRYPAMSLVLAVRRAAEMRLKIDQGEVVAVKRGAAKVEVGAKTLDDVYAEWVKRRGQGLRSLGQYERSYRNHIQPALGATPILDLRKKPIVAMLDIISDTAGAGAMRQVIVNLSSVLNWYATRDDDFRPPVLRGLKGRAPSRSRFLAHEEVAVLWPALDASGDFGLFCKLLLLTGQRREDWADARWAEFAADGATFTIPASRYKTERDHTVPLSTSVRGLLASLPRRPGSDRLFATEVGGFSRGKTRLDALAPGVAHWTLHDLRRTATSLMIEARVRPDYVERVTHPDIAGVAGVYNRYAYLDEKTEALDALAAMIERIVSPPPAGNVVLLRG